MPVWLDEGLAEYFGESIFTGDGFVTGVVPPWREERLKDEIKGGELKSLSALMQVSSQQWANEMDIKNYDQSWSLVQFLVYADDGKYQSGLSKCISEISHGTASSIAWADTLGQYGDLEENWKTWWMSQPESPTRKLYAQAAVATMTSYVARASLAHQSFASFDEFKSAVQNDGLKSLPQDWLPPALIDDTMRLYGSLPNWEISAGTNKQPMVSLTIPDGTRLVGSFTPRGQTVDRVDVDIDDLALVLKNARELLDAGQKEQAKSIVLAAIKLHPRSPLLGDAKKFLQSLR
jgi:hypothetical protein